jgi:hypothetical protein
MGMEERTFYPVCPNRNVAEAFDCFLGPDSCQLDRFLNDQRVHRVSRARALVRAYRRRAYAGATLGIRTVAQVIPKGVTAMRTIAQVVPMGVTVGRRVAQVIPKAITDLNLILTLGWISAWISATWAFSVLAWASNILLHHAQVWLPRGWREGRAVAAVLARRAARLLRRTEGRYAVPPPQRQLILF